MTTVFCKNHCRILMRITRWFQPETVVILIFLPLDHSKISPTNYLLCPPSKALSPFPPLPSISLILPMTPPPPSPIPHSTIPRNTALPSPSFSHHPQRCPPLSLIFPPPPPPLPPCLPIKAVTILHQRKAR
ncbi:hypothetical protein TIFTF001_021671 [Ficus carica]|uniref:Uncharacterized protein n=1 Tax=Ficus carica TaxID=3494 RepID=A0AA88DC33_FICCA|nr:hypothetical protein TIFTF001_021671 [Ficus carica]